MELSGLYIPGIVFLYVPVILISIPLCLLLSKHYSNYYIDNTSGRDIKAKYAE
jgi:hypothetical protein